MLPPEVRSNFRVLPLHNSAFRSSGQGAVKEVSESARDSAFLRLPTPVTGQPAKSFDAKRNRGGCKRKHKESPASYSSVVKQKRGGGAEREPVLARVW